MSVLDLSQYEVDYAILNFHFVDSDNRRFVPDACSSEGKGVLICYDIIGNHQEINFLLKNPFSENEELLVWKGEEVIVDASSRSKIGRLIKNENLIFAGMGELH